MTYICKLPDADGARFVLVEDEAAFHLISAIHEGSLTGCDSFYHPGPAEFDKSPTDEYDEDVSLETLLAMDGAKVLTKADVLEILSEGSDMEDAWQALPVLFGAHLH